MSGAIYCKRRGSDNVKIQLGPQPKGVPAFSQSINIHIYYTAQLSVDKVLALAPLGDTLATLSREKPDRNCDQ